MTRVASANWVMSALTCGLELVCNEQKARTRLDSKSPVAILRALQQIVPIDKPISEPDEGRHSVRASLGVALIVGLLLVSSASAQRSNSFGAPSGPLTFTPIDTTRNLAAPIPAQESRTFSLKNFIPRLSLPS